MFARYSFVALFQHLDAYFLVLPGFCLGSLCLGSERTWLQGSSELASAYLGTFAGLETL